MTSETSDRQLLPTALALPPTIGVDPGQTWTAAVLRIGDHAEHGWTMGPVDKFGTVRRDALPNTVPAVTKLD